MRLPLAVNKQPAQVDWIGLETDPLTRYHVCKAMARGHAEAQETGKTRVAEARAFCAIAPAAFWDALCKRYRAELTLKPLSVPIPGVATDVRRVAEDVGGLVADFPVEDAGYLIGSIYTVMLPAALRAELGAYYTPPPLVARLLDLAERAGFDYRCGTAIDPACGGGAFLAPLALRMVGKSDAASPEWTLRRLGKRLKGLELDPFAAWMTSVLLEAALLPLCIAAKQRMADVVEVGDALQCQDTGQFGLVIGNPPYGRVSLDEPTRKHYARSLYGHANMYGLFTDLALRRVEPGGGEDMLVVFAEVVASDGPINRTRKVALTALALEAGFEAFLTAYLDRSSAPFKKTVSELAWGSYARFASEPDHLIDLRDGRPLKLSQIAFGSASD